MYLADNIIYLNHSLSVSIKLAPSPSPTSPPSPLPLLAYLAVGVVTTVSLFYNLAWHDAAVLALASSRLWLIRPPGIRNQASVISVIK